MGMITSVQWITAWWPNMWTPSKIFVGVGRDGTQSALDTLQGHRKRLGRDCDSIEKTSLDTVHFAGGDSVASVLSRLEYLAAMGFSHAIFDMPDVYDITPLEAFASEIMPAAAELQASRLGRALSRSQS